MIGGHVALVGQCTSIPYEELPAHMIGTPLAYAIAYANLSSSNVGVDFQ